MSYSLEVFDEDWNRVWLYSLSVTEVYDLSELGDSWAELNPHMTEIGVYFERITNLEEAGEFTREELNSYQFPEAFEELTGFPFYRTRPEYKFLTEFWQQGGQ